MNQEIFENLPIEEDSLDEKYMKWPFKEDDWLINLVMTNPNYLDRIMTLRDYSVRNVDIIMLEMIDAVRLYREEKQEQNPSFVKKRKYLKENLNNKKIQITLEDELELKSNIEKYKLYSLIHWLHLNRNPRIVEHCAIQKYNILDVIYPKVQLSIRKVIGSKVYEPVMDEFEEAVNNAWMSIIKYLTKIDTTKVMFSIFVATAHRSALYLKALINQHNYHHQTLTDYKFYNNIEALDDESVMDTKTCQNNHLEEESMEDYLAGLIDDENDFEERLEEIESSNTESNMTTLKSNILSYSFTVLSSSRKPSIQKILAEFFIDIINKNISKELIERNATTIINTMDMYDGTINQINCDTNNKKFYKLFRDFLQFKIQHKIEKFTNLQGKQLNKKEGKKISKSSYYVELTKKERDSMKLLLQNKDKIVQELMEFRNQCLNYNIK